MAHRPGPLTSLAVALLAADVPVLLALASVLVAAPGVGAGAASSPIFEEQAQAIGISFHHAGNNGLTSEFRSVTGSGVCWGDFNGDGYPDLYFVDTRYDNQTAGDPRDPHAEMFRNNGDGTFTLINDTGAEYRGWGNGCAVGDYDGDGKLDLFVAGWGENTLYRDLGGFKFENVTAAAGLSSVGTCSKGYACWGQGAAFGDADGDGCLDLYVADYVRYDPDHPKGNGPRLYDGQENHYFHNNCDGTFTDKTTAAGLDGAPSSSADKTLNAEWGDYDGDGRPDLLLANDESPIILFHNNGDGTFTDKAKAAGIDDSRANMGLAFDDVNGDGRPDVYITHYQGEQGGFYLNNGGGTFKDHSGEGGLVNDTSFVGWGTGFIDYNDDGYADLYRVNGNTLDFGGYNESRQLFENDGTNTKWIDVSASGGSGLAEQTVARGSAVADYRRDGTLGIAISNTADENASFLAERHVSNHWLDIALVGAGRNRFAVGATITVTPAGLPSVSQILRAGTSYDSQDDYVKHFGLGQASAASVHVQWPDGTSGTWSGVPANEVVRLDEGNLAFFNDTLPPTSAVTPSPPPIRGWQQGNVAVTLNATDRGLTWVSGVSTVSWRVDGGVWNTAAPPIRLGNFTRGTHTLELYATDRDGNAEQPHTQTIKVDDDLPVSHATENGFISGWAGVGSTVALSATDGTSGVQAIYVSVDGGPLAAYGTPLAFSGEGTTTVDYFAEDVAGHNENMNALDVNVDTVPPTSTLDEKGPYLADGANEYVTSATTFSVHARDHGSGVATSEYRVDGSAWAAVPDAGFSITGADGPHVIDFRSTDAAHNFEPARSHTFILDDHTPPSIAVVSPLNSTAYVFGAQENLSTLGPAWGPVGPTIGTPTPIVLVGPLLLEASAGRDVSGVAWTAIAIDGRVVANATTSDVSYTWLSWSERAGWHRVSFLAADGLGNVRDVDREVIVLPGSSDGVIATATGGPMLPPTPPPP